MLRKTGYQKLGAPASRPFYDVVVTFYTGKARAKGMVSIGPSTQDLSSFADEATVKNFIDWEDAASSRSDVLFFVVFEDSRPAGMIFLHDIDQTPGEAGVGYYLLSDRYRSRGIGSTALALLIDYVRNETALERLTIMTGEHNVRSRRVAEKNGFIHFRTRTRSQTADLVYFELLLRKAESNARPDRGS